MRRLLGGLLLILTLAAAPLSAQDLGAPPDLQDIVGDGSVLDYGDWDQMAGRAEAEIAESEGVDTKKLKRDAEKEIESLRERYELELDLVERAAARAGMAAKLQRLALDEIDPTTLPVVLILREVMHHLGFDTLHALP